MNKIYDKTRSFLDFFMKTDIVEDIISIDKTHTVVVSREWNPFLDEIGIEIMEDCGCHIKLTVKRYKSDKEWINFIIFNSSHTDIIELDFCGPSVIAKEIITDQILKKILTNNFYDFLIQLNENYIKIKMV